MLANVLRTISRALAIGSFLWCAGIGMWFLATLRLSFFDQTRVRVAPLMLLMFPVIVAGVGCWAGWRQRSVPLFCAALLMLVFCYLTGLSIGAGYLPAGAALLGAAALARVAGRGNSIAV